MKITYNWLKEYIDFPWAWPELVERLTMAGLEQEGVVDQRAQFEGVVVGHVIARDRHPNANRLSVCRVDLGVGEITIVCGAPNVAAGQKVAVIQPGHSLPDYGAIEKVVIRGVESSGMICSEVELGIGEDADGIMVLPDSAKVGQPFSSQAGLDDVILDFEVTPNRPDCLSLAGIAREVRALTGLDVNLPETQTETAASDADAPAFAGIEIEDAAGCPRYVGRVLHGIQVAPSPAWLQQRLTAVGQRPINNVVDVTNLVMLETGQPLHAFDLARLEGGRIVVRAAARGEKVTTLDGSEHDLDEEILVIADSARPVALAGVMGAANSEVGDATSDILLEAAYFDPARVRRGAARLGLSTEASMRFERGADMAAPPQAIERATHLLAAIAGGGVSPPVDVFPGTLPQRAIPLRVSRVNKLLATCLDAGAVRRILELLECRVEIDGDILTTHVPTFRPDLEREVDLIEEVGRIHGFDEIAANTTMQGPMGDLSEPTALLSTKVRHRLTGLGLDEVVTNTIVEADWLELVGAATGPGVNLANPPTEAQGWLRASLLPSLLDVVRRNYNHRAPAVAAFELGKCFASGEPGERLCLAAVLSGRRTASPWRRDHEPAELLDMKGLLEAFIDDPALVFVPEEAPAYRPGHCARARLGDLELGKFGEVAEAVRRRFDIDRPVYIFELSFPVLVQHWQRPLAAYEPLARFPFIERDLAVVLPQAASAAEVTATIRSCAPQLIESVDLFDLYEGERITSGRRSLAFSLRLRSADATLEDGQANQVIDSVLARLKERFGAELRDS